MHHRYEQSAAATTFHFRLSDQSIVDSLDLPSSNQSDPVCGDNESQTSNEIAAEYQKYKQVEEEEKN